MANSSSSTPRSSAESTVTHPAPFDPDVTATLSFADAPKPNITPANFAPMWRPHPRPWSRIAVPGSSRTIGLRRIWKRIGGIPQSKDDGHYIEGILELRSNGQGPRKSRRTERHVPVWGDAQWAAILPSAIEIVEKELAQALEIVARADATNRKSITLEQPKSHVPRKRNSRRQPLNVYLPASLLPLSSNNSPVRLAAIVEDPNEDTEGLEEHITKRSKRRMSRRVSMLPKIEDSILPSPATTRARSHVFSSPIKRRATEQLSEPKTPATPATRDIASLFTATTAVASPFSSSMKSLTPISNPPLQNEIKPETNKLSDVSPVVIFDQSTPKIDTEPAIEVRRRQSLYNCRRRETLSVNLEQKLLGPARAATSGRRHSFVHPETPLALQSVSKTATSTRRHTFQAGALGVFLTSSKQPIKNSPDFCSISGKPIQGPKNAALNFASRDLDSCTNHGAPLPTQDETVIVDARKNPDIFGSGPPVQSHHSPVEIQQAAFEMGLVEESAMPVSRPPERDDQEELVTIAAAPSPIAVKQQAFTAPNKPIDRAHDGLFINGIIDVSNDSTEMDTDNSGENTCEAADDDCIVSRQPGAELNESLLLPLPETADAEGETEPVVTADEYGWQSPTAAELEGSINSRRTSRTFHLSADTAALPLSPARININAHFLSEDQDQSGESDVADDADVFQDAGVDDTEVSEIVEDVADTNELFSERSLHTNNDGDNLSPASSAEEGDDAEYTVTQPFNMFNASEEDATSTMTVDFVAFAQVDLSAHEDSETEMLRNFVTRVKADKTAKAAAAAETASVHGLAKLQRKRRSGSTGSTALPSGSPMAKKEIVGILDSPFNLKTRVPFGEKDHNMSPSPKKKRRVVTILDSNDENRACNLLSKPLLDDNSPPRPKRRRRKMEADTDGIFNPEFRAHSKEESPAAIPEAAPGPRRSRRTRSQNTVKITASTAATNSALSLIPVRLPGSLNLNGEDGYSLTASSLSLRRNDEKELAATTRINTRKNKGDAEPPCIVVARQSQDALRSLQAMGQRSTVDLQLRPQSAEEDTDKDKAGGGNDSQGGSHKNKTTSSHSAKVVRWAEVLVRFQTTDGETADKSLAATGSVIAKTAVDTEVFIKSALTGSARDLETAEERQAPAGCVVADAPEVASAILPVAPCASSVASLPQASEPKESFIPRRTTRISRLQPPTPRTVIASAAAAKAAARSTTGQASAQSIAPAGPAPMGLKALPSGSTSARRMAAKRAKIVGMGMAGNGTPAPKRRLTRTA